MDDFLTMYSRLESAGICPRDFMVYVSKDIYHVTTGTIVLQRMDQEWEN